MEVVSVGTAGVVPRDVHFQRPEAPLWPLKRVILVTDPHSTPDSFPHNFFLKNVILTGVLTVSHSTKRKYLVIIGSLGNQLFVVRNR